MRNATHRKCIAAIFFILSFFGACDLSAKEHPAAQPVLIVFQSISCHRCIEVKNELMPQIDREYRGRLSIEYRDIGDIENYKQLLSLEKKYKANLKNVMPVFYISGRFLDSSGELAGPLRGLINRALEIPFEEGEGLPAVNLSDYFRSFKLIFILGAGLVDGINPCAFTVIVFFISFLALQGYKRKELTFIGLSFILALFITYVLIGLGLFAFLYRLKSFWLISRAINFSLGSISIVLAILALYDFLRFKETRDTAGLVLQLPQGIKNRIHYIVGLHYRLDKNKPADENKKNIPKLVASAFITGFLITILEAVCTGQTYLPTLGFILKTTAFKLQALVYILLYNLMFILPLVVIFIFALLGTSSSEFSKFLKRNMLAVKLAMALLFFSLGIFLIWRG